LVTDVGRARERRDRAPVVSVDPRGVRAAVGLAAGPAPRYPVTVKTLSIAMIVRDEARTLPRCLASLEGLGAELVVVDTGSADDTPGLAARAGAIVAHVPWTGDFAEARNAALERATGDWVLVLDADESLPPETHAALPATLADATRDGFAALSLVVRNHAPPGELAAWQDARLVRLFRRDPRHRYRGAIHEQIAAAIVEAGGRIGASALRVDHWGYVERTAQGGVDRAARNLAALERALAAAPDDAYLHFQLGATRQAAGAPADAHASLTHALALGGLSPEVTANAWMKVAQLALAAQDDATAADAAQRCLTLRPDDVVALQVLGLAAFGLGQLAVARDALTRLLVAPALAPSHRADIARLVGALPR
jgi:hypothetical protein